MTSLEHNIAYFEAHKAEVAASAGDDTSVLISDGEVVGYFEDDFAAIHYAREHLSPLGGWLVRPVFDAAQLLVASNFRLSEHS